MDEQRDDPRRMPISSGREQEGVVHITPLLQEPSIESWQLISSCNAIAGGTEDGAERGQMLNDRCEGPLCRRVGNTV